MKTNIVSTARIVALAASLFAIPFIASAKESAATPDRASQLLQSNGSIDLKAAGRFVEMGTYRIQVSSKLGRPDITLADGTWLYSNHSVDNSNAVGTLVVQFDARGQVSQLKLVTPAVALAMTKPQPQKPSDKEVFASRQ